MTTNVRSSFLSTILLILTSTACTQNTKSTAYDEEFGPCADGEWGYGSLNDLQVSSNGDDTTGDGSVDAPYQTMGRAVRDASDGVGTDRVFLWPGEYSYSDTDETGTSFGVISFELVGCGPDESRVALVESIGRLSALEGVALMGDTVVIYNSDEGQTVVRDVNVSNVNDTDKALYVLEGEAILEDIWIEGVQETSLYLQGGQVEIDNLNIYDVGIGIVSSATVKASNITIEKVSNVDPNLEKAGFGIYLWSAGSLTLTNATISDTLSPGIGVFEDSELKLSQVTLDNVGGYSCADGIVVAKKREGYSSDDYQQPHLSLTDVVINNTIRSAVLVDDGQVDLVENLITSDIGYTGEEDIGFFMQNGAVVNDTTFTDYVSLSEGDELDDCGW